MRSLPVWEEGAVSPVIGVMLMLAVTLIIAAVVSAFAGGAISGPSKTPQATIQATYSQAHGMTISHMGGDPIPVSSTTVYVRPTNSFGENVTRYSWHIDKSVILVDETMSWDTSTSFIAGDTVYIGKKDINDLKKVQTRPDMTTENESANSILDFMRAEAGKSFVIEFHDGSGKMIGQSVVIIAT
ncbi:MAG: type IV pilin N-terminal domain-containing protein [Methanoregula sp.]|nr:type IV pilin N-terminal domain-containing protein [Methanoregula sp.]